MSRLNSNRRIQIDTSEPRYDEGDSNDGSEFQPSNSDATEDLDPFMGVKVRRKASRLRDYQGDYIDVRPRPHLMKILEKQGDRKVLFADKVIKFTGSGKMKRRILLVTDFAIYIADPETDALKRRVALAAVEKLCLSELIDNFFAINIPTEYDLLMASTRKTEIVTVLVDATKSASDYELEVALSNRFEYSAAADVVKEVQFEEVEGGVKTRIVQR
ncbi:myosin IB heavy chain-like [Salvia divinorum]|uniref:Myosin IB heavy chain-like n=1 Tax=Salvia divinorum TaxID=28513 RepID=A0ABD1I9Y3_SALDI